MPNSRLPRVLLDTNVWRYLADHSTVEQFRRDINGKCSVLVAPAAVYETLRAKDTNMRDRVVRFQCHHSWTRLMPEAYLESAELVEVVATHMPHWLMNQSSSLNYRRNEFDWKRKTGGFWSRANTAPGTLAQTIVYIEGDMLRDARDLATEARAENLEMGQSISFGNASLIKTEELVATSTQEARKVESWRMSARSYYERMTFHEPLSTWLLDRVNMAMALRMYWDWNSFWWDLVSEVEMPRSWLRWATSYLQSYRRITGGTPCDSQLCSHLVDCDYFVSADKALVQIVERCQDAAKFSMGRPMLVEAGIKCPVALKDFVSTLH